MGQHEQRSSHRRDARIAGGLLLGLILLGVGAASAQQVDGRVEATAPSEPGGSEPGRSEPGGSQPGGSQPSTLSPQQMLERSRNTLERMQVGADAIRRQLAEARETRDVVKSLCLDDKLSQMDVARRSAADRVSGLEISVESANGERARHEFAVITALRERADALMAEANQCIGEETGAIGDASLVVTVDPEIADADPTIPTDTLVGVPPVLASPTL